jgi:hypothetical protein
MDSALTKNGNASDTAVIISMPLKYSMPLSAAGKQVASGDCQTQFNSATNLRILQSLIDMDEAIVPLRQARHNGLDGLDNVKGGNGPKFYYDIVCKDHIFGAQE